MTTTLSPAPFQKFFDNNGTPLAKGLLFTYLAGTTTKTTTWTDSSGGTANSNPIVLDYRGECNLWISPNVGYKYVLAPATDTDPPTNPIKTIDNVVNSQLITLYGGVDTGIADAYVLNFTANFSALTDGIVIYWIPSHSNTGASTINVNGLGVVAIVSSDGTAATAGLIAANQFIGIMYKGGSWYVITPQFLQGSFTGTLTGMSGTVTGTIYYKITNGLCTLYIKGVAITGTSNSTSMTVTGLPAAVVPSSPVVSELVPTFVVDNGSTLLGTINVTVSGSFLDVFPLAVSGSVVTIGAFTNTGTKGLSANWSITYPL